MDRILAEILDTNCKEEGNIICLLQRVQDQFGYIPEEAIYKFAEILDIPASKFYSVLTFYPKFRTEPPGQNTVTVCCGAACHIKGSEKILDEIYKKLPMKEGSDTSVDLRYTVQKATCIGACNIAPVVILNDTVHGNMDPQKTSELLGL